MALDALAVGIQHRKVNWVLDADIRGCFDAIDHDWLMKFVEHRIRDRRVHRHLKKWLKAGVLEEGTWAPGGGRKRGCARGQAQALCWQISTGTTSSTCGPRPGAGTTPGERSFSWFR